MLSRLFVITASIFFLTGFMSFESPDPDSLLKDVKQDVLVYSSPLTLDKLLVKPETQQKRYQDYLLHYFSPWNNQALLYTTPRTQEIEEKLIKNFKLHPGWGENQRPRTDIWINEVVRNMDIKSYPNRSKTAITTNVVNLRSLPTNEPIFQHWSGAGQGYPFDQLSVSLLPANLPIKVVQLSQDGAWALALTPYNAIGWLPINDLAFVDKSFMARWQTNRYAAILKDKLPLNDLEQHFLCFARIGAIYPLIDETQNSYRILVASSDLHHQAVSQMMMLSKNDATLLPLPLTTRNIAKIANTMLGQPYDWGGNYGYRDCSSTMMDIFATFGLWLPRSSKDQAAAGTYFSLEQLENLAAKEAFIEKHATPFLTLLWSKGHVVLYLGKQGTRHYIYQTMWGLPTWTWFNGDGRLVIGKTVITPLDFGEDISLNASSFLSRARGMVVLVEHSH